MKELDILVWTMGIGFTFNFALMALLWQSMNKRFDKLDEKVTDIDRRLCRLEGAFSSKDYCMIKDDRHVQKAE